MTLRCDGTTSNKYEDLTPRKYKYALSLSIFFLFFFIMHAKVRSFVLLLVIVFSSFNIFMILRIFGFFYCDFIISNQFSCDLFVVFYRNFHNKQVVFGFKLKNEFRRFINNYFTPVKLHYIFNE